MNITTTMATQRIDTKSTGSLTVNNNCFRELLHLSDLFITDGEGDLAITFLTKRILQLLSDQERKYIASGRFPDDTGRKSGFRAALRLSGIIVPVILSAGVFW
jgi:hypothetical protein